jgi:DNA-binding PadR family transcriptional regulator
LTVIPLAPHARTLGRFREPARWVLVALDGDPLDLTALYDAVRRLDGPVGPATLVGALSRLERLQLVDSVMTSDRPTMYRLAILDEKARAQGREAR